MGKEIAVAIIGGDDRELVVIRELTDKGYRLKTFGFPEELLPVGVISCQSPAETVRDAPVIILPMPGIKENGCLYAKYSPHDVKITMEDLFPAAPGAWVFVGKASYYLKTIIESCRFRLIEIAELDQVAIPNSIPTAEGALQLAMEQLPITLHGAKTFVIGFGRVGETLALMLKGIGAEVIVAARNPSQREKCRILGCRPLELCRLRESIYEADLIYNTVPSPILSQDILQRMKQEALIIDLASGRGGTDFHAAEQLGIRALLAPGLPGKVAPLSAGRILARFYPALIDRCLSEGSSH